MRKRKYNPKRRIVKSTDEARLESLSKTVVYTGNSAHKKHPGDFGLTPPAQPRLNKTLCDGTHVNRKEAMRLLRSGAKLGLISILEWNGLPQNIWAVSQDGIPLEAQLENVESATYHGYPMGSGDPLAREIFARWKEGATSD
jgi:hypothetical protein